MCPLRWMFRPIEAKVYSVEVAINIHDGETAVVVFEGHYNVIIHQHIKLNIGNLHFLKFIARNWFS